MYVLYPRNRVETDAGMRSHCQLSRAAVVAGRKAPPQSCGTIQPDPSLSLSLNRWLQPQPRGWLRRARVAWSRHCSVAGIPPLCLWPCSQISRPCLLAPPIQFCLPASVGCGSASKPPPSIRCYHYLPCTSLQSLGNWLLYPSFCPNQWYLLIIPRMGPLWKSSVAFYP